MVNSTKSLSFFSYKLWSDSSPAIGSEAFHCPMQRGFRRVRNKEPVVSDLINKDNTAQSIGHLAQQGVYEFHADPQLLDRSDGVKIVAELLQLKHCESSITHRVTQILEKYQDNPILRGKQIVKLERGDEAIPEPFVLKLQRKELKFYAAMDCLYTEPDGTFHILDFKTGKSEFDERQAYTYLVAAKHQYPEQPAVASFYNLESQKRSRVITANPEQLQRLEVIFADIAQQYTDESRHYRENKSAFHLIFRPNPGSQCQYCSFSSICEYTAFKA